MLKRKYRVEKKGGEDKCPAFLLSLALFFYFMCPVHGLAGEGGTKPAITGVLLTKCQEQLCINFSLDGGLTLNIEKILQSGIPVKYLFEISLKKKRLLWDDELKHIELIRTIILDNIRDEYVLTFYYPSTRIITVSTLDEALEYLFNIRQLPLIPLKRLARGERYFIGIRAAAKKGEASMPFGRLVKIFSSFGFSTDSYEIEFRY